MSSTASPGSAFPASGEAKLPNLIFAVTKGAIAIFGVSGVLYGAGFLALRSRFASVSVWSAAPSNSSDIAEVGARFFYDLILIPAVIIERLFHSTIVSLLIAFVALALAGFLWDRRAWLHRFRKNPASARVGWGDRLYSSSPALFLAVCRATTQCLVTPERRAACGSSSAKLRAIWIVCNNESRQTEVILKERVGTVFIGARQPLRNSDCEESNSRKTPEQ